MVGWTPLVVTHTEPWAGCAPATQVSLDCICTLITMSDIGIKVQIQNFTNMDTNTNTKMFSSNVLLGVVMLEKI